VRKQRPVGTPVFCILIIAGQGNIDWHVHFSSIAFFLDAPVYCLLVTIALGQLESPVLSLAGWRAKLAGQADTYYDWNNYSGLNLIFFRWRE